MSRKIVPDPELWDIVRAAITPLTTRIGVAKPLPLPESMPAKSPPIFTKQKSAAIPNPAPRPRQPQKAIPPALTGLDRRTTQKLSRGQADIDARLDLHGYSLELARVELRRFLHETRHQGLRTVLIITGKGDSPFARHTLHGKDTWHAPERMGRLRRAVTDWFEEPEFRTHISGFQPAHPRHGGGGAYYVRLRRHDRGKP